MCGIIGLYNFSNKEPVDPALLKRMSDLLVHRGPDDAGTYSKGPVGLAMRRLCIIDAEKGGQPMSSDDGRIQLIFNGEIYNFQELRKELSAAGIRFKTNSDTEVILRLYERVGINCVKRLRGMFAIALWDEAHDRLLLARDRIGKKPLMYSLNANRLAWSSEIQPLLQLPDLSKDIDLEAIDLYLGLQYIPSPWTAYASIRKLPPAHYLVLEKGKARLERYWDLSAIQASVDLSLDEAKEMLREKIKESVRIRMVADVPVGAFLSGGIDSTLVVGVMSQLSRRPIKTFSIGFEEADYSELAYAREAAVHFKTDHSEFVVKPQMSDVLPKLAKHFGEPFGDSSALPTYYLAKETRKQVTVALTGDGGDENFGGYTRYADLNIIRHFHKLPAPLRRSLSPIGHVLPRKGRRFFQDILPSSPEASYLHWIGIFTEREKSEMYTPAFLARLNKLSRSGAYLTGLFDQARNKDFVNRMSFVDILSYLPDCLMTKVDITTMANSLEARSPLLDQELVEFASSLRGDWKLKGTSTGKWILKEAFRDSLPQPILNRPKMGFGLPIDSWFRGYMKDYWRDLVLSADALKRGYFQKAALEKLFDDHISGRRNNGYRMWVLLMLELWHLQT